MSRSFTYEEICLIYRCERNADNNQALGEILGRTDTSIDWVHRYIESGGIGPRPSMRLLELIESVSDALGTSARGQIKRLRV